MQAKKTLAALAIVLIGAAASQAATLVYNNGASYSGFYLNPGGNFVGDEIILGGGPRIASTFAFEYFGSGFSGNEQFQIRFYNNDGASLGGPFNTQLPNSIFYDSGLQTLLAPIDASGRNTYLFDLSSLAITLPDRFTWAVQFSGITAGEVAGVSIYDPPALGNNFDDFWFNTGSAWELRSTNGLAINFGAQITAVPEPSTYVLAILGGICGLALLHRRKNQR